VGGGNGNRNVRDNDGKTQLDLIRSTPLIQSDLVDMLVELLHQHGALDNLPNWDRIEVSPASGQVPATVFRKGTNDWNRFTLLETILNYYVGGYEFRYRGTGMLARLPDGSPIPGSVFTPTPNANTMSFPDLTRGLIVRPSHDSSNSTRISVNLLNSTNGIDCSKDVPLEFGDVVEIPERDHSLGDAPVGLTIGQADSIVSYLKGNAHLVVRDQKADLPLEPYSDLSYIGAVLHQEAAQQLLLSSSDLAHVIVSRHDPKTGKERQWILDCSVSRKPQEAMRPPSRRGIRLPGQNFPYSSTDGNTPPVPDFRLRDGDVIEVPEKP
jgi:hypothetical protein